MFFLFFSLLKSSTSHKNIQVLFYSLLFFIIVIYCLFVYLFIQFLIPRWSSNSPTQRCALLHESPCRRKLEHEGSNLHLRACCWTRCLRCLALTSARSSSMKRSFGASLLRSTFRGQRKASGSCLFVCLHVCLFVCLFVCSFVCWLLRKEFHSSSSSSLPFHFFSFFLLLKSTLTTAPEPANSEEDDHAGAPVAFSL